MMAMDTESTEQRQAYVKPCLRPIELLTNEVMGSNCKLDGGEDCGTILNPAYDIGS
jgi:hypothetical protein